MDREMVTVILLPEGTSEAKEVTVPLADAVVEYFRLERKGAKSIGEIKVFMALGLALGTLSVGDGASKLYAALEVK